MASNGDCLPWCNGAAKHGDVFYKVDIPKIDVVNPVGFRDSTVAGIASGPIIMRGRSLAQESKCSWNVRMHKKPQTGHVNIRT